MAFGDRKPPSKFRALNQAGTQHHERSEVNQASRRRWSEEDAPASYDQQLWSFALMFRDLAGRNGVYVDGRLPVVYVAIERTINWFDAKAGSRPFQRRGDGTIEMTYRQAYKYVDGQGRWAKVVEAAIDEFWTRAWDDDALHDFCDFEIFDQMMHVVCDRAYSRHLQSTHVKTTPEPVRWNRDGHRKRRITK